MKNLFQLIIVLVILASFFRQGGIFFVLIMFFAVIWIVRQLKEATQADLANAPQWKRNLHEAYLKIRQELEQTAKVPQDQEIGWERVVSDAADPYLEPEPARETAPRKDKDQRAAKKPIIKAEAQSDRSQRLEELRKRYRKETPRRRERQKPAAAKMPDMNLQQAVVWSEILSPPVALRD